MANKKTGGFLLKQRAFLKLYLLEDIEKNKEHGLQMLARLIKSFENYGYVPSHNEVYKTLHKLYSDGLVKRKEEIKGIPDENLQKIINYQLTDKGKEELDLYRKQMKVELERCIRLMEKALRDHYGPLRT